MASRLQQARDYGRAVKSNAAGRMARAGEAEAAGGGPEDPVADAAAGYEVVRAAGSSAASGLRSGASRVGTPSDAAQTVTKLIWAAALGIIVLEIASLATGQQWSFSLPGGNPLNKSPYLPLYTGENVTQPTSTPAAGTQPAANPSIVNHLGANAPGFGI